MSDLLPIKDLAGLSKPLSKLIDTVGNAFGALYEPTRIRKKAQAEADAAIIRAKANAEIEEIEFFASERVKFLELRRQRNIERITTYAKDQLPDTVTEEKVDEDWTIQFFNLSQDIGNEEMQMIWGKILAGEVARPGSFSFQTLSTLKLLRQEDAFVFKKLCNYVWGNKHVIHYYKIHPYFTENGMKWDDLVNLITIGLVTEKSGWNMEPGTTRKLMYFEHLYEFKNIATYKKRLEGLGLSVAGRELFSICEREPDNVYLSRVVNDYSKEDSKIKIAKL